MPALVPSPAEELARQRIAAASARAHEAMSDARMLLAGVCADAQWTSRGIRALQGELDETRRELDDHVAVLHSGAMRPYD